MSMYQIEDFIESAVRAVAMSDLGKLEKRNLIHTLFEMEEYGDCSFTNLRTIHEMVACSYSFVFEAKEMYNYNENPDIYDPEKGSYSQGDVYYDPGTNKFCVDAGSKAWEEMCKIGAITGEGAAPVDLLPHIEVLKTLKVLMENMDGYIRQGYYALMSLTGAFDDMTDEDCLIIFGTDKERAEEILDGDEQLSISDSLLENTKTCSILGHTCKFTAEVVTSENGDIVLKGFSSEMYLLNVFNRNVPFTAVVKPDFAYTILTNDAKQMFETDGVINENALNIHISRFCEAFPLESFVMEIDHALSFSKEPAFLDPFISHYMSARNIPADTQIEIPRMWCEYNITPTGSLCDIYTQIKAENNAFCFDLRLRSGCEITREEYNTDK